MAEEQKGFFRGLWGKLTGAEQDPEPIDAAIQDVLADAQAEQVPAPLQAAEKIAADEQTPEPAQKPSLFQRLKQGLSRTHEGLVAKIDTLLLGKKQIDADMLEELEEILITADIGVTTTVELIRTLE